MNKTVKYDGEVRISPLSQSHNAAMGIYSIALGLECKAMHDYSIMIGHGLTSDEPYQIKIGTAQHCCAFTPSLGEYHEFREVLHALLEVSAEPHISEAALDPNGICPECKQSLHIEPQRPEQSTGCQLDDAGGSAPSGIRDEQSESGLAAPTQHPQRPDGGDTSVTFGSGWKLERTTDDSFPFRLTEPNGINAWEPEKGSIVVGFFRHLMKAAPAPPAVGEGVVEALHAMEDRWLASVAGKDSSRPIPTFDPIASRAGVPGEDDYDNEAHGVRRCATELGKYAVSIANTAPPSREVGDGLAWTEEDMAKPWGAEVAALRHLADDPALNIGQAAILRHCAKRVEGTATLTTVGPEIVDRFKVACRALIRERVVYGEDVETLYDVLRALETLSAAPRQVGDAVAHIVSRGVNGICTIELPPGEYLVYPMGAQPAPGAVDVVSLVGPIERDDAYDRDYIPLPGGWEIQTKGLGSTFRIAGPQDDDRLPVPDSPYLHDTLTRMARDIHAAVEPFNASNGERK